jgi:DNA-binding NtrC family response regulator
MYNILVADSNGALRNLLGSVLSAAGYEVILAGDGVEALKAARNCNGPIHLLCANVAVRRMNGLSLAEQLLPEHPEMKVLILVTDHPWLLSVEPVGTEGHHPEFSVLRKPFTIQELTATIQQMLATSAAAG